MQFLHAVYEVARKDVLQHIRTKRLLVIGIFFIVVLQLVTMVIPLAFGLADEDPEPGQPANENIWFFFHLNASILGGLFAIQLLAIVLTADAVCSEWGNRTIFLLLSKPVSRTAFVVGKYVGALVSTLPVILVLYVLQYLLMMAVYAGQPTADEAFGFVQMLLVLSLGTAVIAAIALFISTLTRSNVMALILSLLGALLLFPIIGAIGDISLEVDRAAYFNSQDFDGGNFNEEDMPQPEEWKYDWSHYANPSGTLAAAPQMLIVGENQDDDFAGALSGFIPTGSPQRTWLSILCGFAYTALFIGLAILRVNKRNFE